MLYQAHAYEPRSIIIIARTLDAMWAWRDYTFSVAYKMTSINTVASEKESAENVSIPAKMQQENRQSDAPVQEPPDTTRTRARERIWSTCLSTLVASIPALLIGYTIAFPSSALLVLMDGWREGHLPSKDYQFDTELADIFSVSE